MDETKKVYDAEKGSRYDPDDQPKAHSAGEPSPNYWVPATYILALLLLGTGMLAVAWRMDAKKAEREAALLYRSYRTELSRAVQCEVRGNTLHLDQHFRPCRPDPEAP